MIARGVGGSAGELIQAASRIEEELRSTHEGAYGRWLSETIGALKLVNRRCVDALLSWGTRIATTNYDNLFEDASQLSPITWLATDTAHQVVRGERQGVLHIHGHYSLVNTVVLGAKRYEEICSNTSAQNLLRSVMTRDTIVFVGCGAGLEDPNFGRLLEWSKEALRQCHHTHYVLVRARDRNSAFSQFSGVNIEPLVYGNEYDDLPIFLESIGEQARLRQLIPSPIDSLRSKQNDYELRISEIDRDTTLTPIDFIRQHFVTARQLWDAGGRRTASMHMLSVLGNKGKSLSATDNIEFILDAIELLASNGFDYAATSMLGALEESMSGTFDDSKKLRRFRELLTRCLKQSFDIDGFQKEFAVRMKEASAGEREQLKVERAEIYLLSGDLVRASICLEESDE